MKHEAVRNETRQVYAFAEAVPHRKHMCGWNGLAVEGYIVSYLNVVHRCRCIVAVSHI